MIDLRKTSLGDTPRRPTRTDIAPGDAPRTPRGSAPTKFMLPKTDLTTVNKIRQAISRPRSDAPAPAPAPSQQQPAPAPSATTASNNYSPAAESYSSSGGGSGGGGSSYTEERTTNNEQPTTNPQKAGMDIAAIIFMTLVVGGLIWYGGTLPNKGTVKN